MVGFDVFTDQPKPRQFACQHGSRSGELWFTGRSTRTYEAKTTISAALKPMFYDKGTSTDQDDVRNLRCQPLPLLHLPVRQMERWNRFERLAGENSDYCLAVELVPEALGGPVVHYEVGEVEAPGGAEGGLDAP